MNNLIFSLGVIGNALSFLIFLAPINTFLRIVKNQSTEEFNPAPYVVTLLNCSLWVYYGVTKPGAYLIATVNAAGILLEAIYVVLFLIYASPNLRAKTAVLVGVLDAVFFVGVVFVTKFGVEKTLQVLVVGVICSCLNTLMYASPLSAMKIVVTTKSVEYMPFLLSFFLFLNGGVWTFYAILANDIFAATSHSEHFEEEILNLRNTLLKSELEKERIALELEEEKKDRAHRERRLAEQAKKIANLSSLVLCSEKDEKSTNLSKALGSKILIGCISFNLHKQQCRDRVDGEIVRNVVRWSIRNLL
ncbi:uncharacterized protein A4U43_C07F14040 [Asparagus officinalis]|uniref:Bidirectional sugar transporter SWEET n=1 Tax=Asparagus officinalis TaxID=4686 RepID=A0A5P1EH17_ASPOF|nr:bidirectional sugar transporter SWEET17-like [Asparagus officinalis]ONK63340.1 uncharacterized protein A4U43_C07F14040 [Asparagus officinalis]